MGGGEELQYVDFDPGVARLKDDQTNKLVKLTKALVERPALKPEIGATFDATKDVAALGRQQVREKMKSCASRKSLRVANPPRRWRIDPGRRRLRAAAAQGLPGGVQYDAGVGRAGSAARCCRHERCGSWDVGGNRRGLAERPKKGAVTLVQHGLSLSELDQQPRKSTAAWGTGPAKPMTEREMVREELERRLRPTSPSTRTISRP